MIVCPICGFPATRRVSSDSTGSEVGACKCGRFHIRYVSGGGEVFFVHIKPSVYSGSFRFHPGDGKCDVSGAYTPLPHFIRMYEDEVTEAAVRKVMDS